MPRLSIIVPVYNVEKYLDRCVTSIRNQAFLDWELILVDDGSQDKSPLMCDGFAKEDQRIRVIHKENGGLSSARNTGLKEAKGEYVGFVDSDDTINKDMYTKMIEIADITNVDFLMSDYIRIPSDGSSYLKTLSIRGGLYTKEDIQKDIYPSLIMGGNIDHGPLLSVCHCLYRLTFLKSKELFFDDDILWSEDNLFSAKVGYCAESFYYLKGEGLYNYYQNQGTITTSFRKDSWHIYLKMNEYLHEFFRNKKDYDFTQELKWHLIYYACVSVSQTRSLTKEKAEEELRNILYNSRLENAFKNVDLSGVSTKLKIQLLLMKYKMISLLDCFINRKRKIVK